MVVAEAGKSKALRSSEGVNKSTVQVNSDENPFMKHSVKKDWEKKLSLRYRYIILQYIYMYNTKV